MIFKNNNVYNLRKDNSNKEDYYANPRKELPTLFPSELRV